MRGTLTIPMLVLLAGGSAYPQKRYEKKGGYRFPEDSLAARDAMRELGRIQEIAKPYCSSGEKDACTVVQNAGRLAQGLNGYGGGGGAYQANGPPREYSENLQRMASVLESLAASHPDKGSAPAPGRASSISLDAAFAWLSQDLEAKARDCQSFGMGRLVPVKVRTLRAGPVADPGWELFYNCSFGGMTGDEIRAPGLTETTVPIPPAARCMFRARRGGREVQAGPIPVFDKPSVTVEISVP